MNILKYFIVKLVKDYSNTLEHLQKMLKIHYFLRRICLLKWFCPFIKPRMPLLIIDDIQALFDLNGNLRKDTDLSYIIDLYSMKWLDEGYAKIVFVSNECSIFNDFTQLSGWASRLRLCALKPLNLENFNSIIANNKSIFLKTQDEYAKFFKYFGGDLRTLQ